MRTFSISFLLVLLGLLGCQSSKTSKIDNSHTDNKESAKRNTRYKPFTEFKGDTLQYLNYNFVEHKDQYIGKPFSVFYHDLEIPVKSATAGPDANNGFVSSGIDLSFYDDGTTNYLMTSDNLPSYFIIVKWEKPLSADAFFQLDKANNWNWSPSHEAFLANEIIKDVAVMKYINPQSTKK